MLCIGKITEAKNKPVYLLILLNSNNTLPKSLERQALKYLSSQMEYGF